MRDQRFTFLCTNAERLCLERVAKRYRRSKGDTIRLLILQAVEAMASDPEVVVKKDSMPQNVQNTNERLSTKSK
jgi:hypothetical protein